MFTLPKLEYGYNALEPYIDTKTMEIHHTKHHQAYVDNLNKALEKEPALSGKSLEELLAEDAKIAPQGIKEAVLNHGGGHYNHSFFWEIMGPPKGKEPEGKLLEAIVSTFGDLAKFKEAFTSKALGVFGSGWAFLIMTPDKKLVLKRHSFQNSPVMRGNIPLLGIDVWEHAYYIKYQNRRAEYIEAWWNVVNWRKVEENFAEAL